MLRVPKTVNIRGNEYRIERPETIRDAHADCNVEKQIIRIPKKPRAYPAYRLLIHEYCHCLIKESLPGELPIEQEELLADSFEAIIWKLVKGGKL